MSESRAVYRKSLQVDEDGTGGSGYIGIEAALPDIVALFVVDQRDGDAHVGWTLHRHDSVVGLIKRAADLASQEDYQPSRDIGKEADDPDLRPQDCRKYQTGYVGQETLGIGKTWLSVSAPRTGTVLIDVDSEDSGDAGLFIPVDRCRQLLDALDEAASKLRHY